MTKQSTYRFWLVSLLLWMGWGGRLCAQVDTDFWFAVPYLTDSHDDSQTPGYGKMCFTAFEDTAVVTITQPGVTKTNDPKYFAPIRLTILPHTSQDVSVGNGNGMINRVSKSGKLPYGIHIESDHKITAYYAQVNQNSEIYTLKGRNALGRTFLVGMQKRHGNGFSAASSIDILATEDNTKVTVNTPVVTRTNPSSTTITMTLQKGEVLTVQAMNESAANHLGGTVITSDKPIVVNSNDDSVASFGQDLVGEQIVPFDLAGSEYIAIKHNANNDSEKLYLFTYPGRPIQYSVAGGQQQTLQGGQMATVTLTQEATYIEADDDFVCFQLTGEGGELGGTVLPRLNCTGSTDVVLRRRFTEQTTTLLVQTPYTGDFTVNGQPLQEPFTPVPNAPQWSYVNLKDGPQNASKSHYVQDVCAVSNSKSVFHASILDGGNGTCSYGYFSDYNVVQLVAHADKEVYQAGETIYLSIEDSALFADVVWTFPDGSAHAGASVEVPVEKATDGGTYTATAESKDGCEVRLEWNTVTVQVEIDEPLPNPDFSLELLTKEAEVCDGDETVTLRCKVQKGVPSTCEVTIIGNKNTTETLEVKVDKQGEVELEVPLPELFPNAYKVQLVFYDESSAEGETLTAQLTAQLRVLYDPEKVFAQKWDNVLAIYSPDYSGYDQLTLTREYQWYKNGVPMAEETGSYLHLAGKLEETDYYQVEVTREDDAVKLMTCAYYPHKATYQAPAAASAEKKLIDGHLYIKVGEQYYTPQGERVQPME